MYRIVYTQKDGNIKIIHAWTYHEAKMIAESDFNHNVLQFESIHIYIEDCKTHINDNLCVSYSLVAKGLISDTLTFEEIKGV